MSRMSESKLEHRGKWKRRIVLSLPGYVFVVPAVFCLTKVGADIWSLGLIAFSASSGLCVGIAAALSVLVEGAE